MTIRAFIRTCLFTGSVLLSSCAYMQTHKNIEESFQQHTGYQLEPDFQLYKSGARYYLALNQVSLRKHYPTIHDSIFLKGKNAPVLEQVDGSTSRIYKEISRGTATVLQQADGYADLTVLRDELNSHPTPWEKRLPAGASVCNIRAEIAGKPISWIEENSSSELAGSVKLLSAIDQVIIDWPCTILYNAAIPVMAPFVFFHDFLTEE